MVKGILIFETGEVQQIGDLTSLQNIIITIEQLLPQLKKQERDRVLELWSPEELERAATEIKNARGNKEQ